MRATYKYYFKRLAKAFSFIIHYIEFIFIKAVNWVINRFDSAYARMINRFLEKSVSNKSYVKFFWKDLKEFKKEIDSKKDL
ncbi:MAG: hypothetical protein QG614_557 [Patescibacteria group bacterium]|nr:hypothetical protein [Patescibacteria group bacterium]